MTCTAFTVFGAAGFVGRELVRQLEAQGASVQVVTRDSWPSPGTRLGHAIYAIGMTAGFDDQLIETFDRHLLRLHHALSSYSYDSFTYLSSTRIYAGAETAHEGATLCVRPAERDHVYNITKIAGESLCLSQDRADVRAVRLSNVIGEGDDAKTFVAAVLREAVTTGSVRIRQSPQSSKDYIALADAAGAIIKVARHGTRPIYNIASGHNVTHQSIADMIEAAGYSCQFEEQGPVVVFPAIDMTLYQGEFGPIETDPISAIGALVAAKRAGGGQT